MRCGCLVCVLYVEPEGGRVVTGGGVGGGGLDRCTLSGFWVVCSTASNKRTVQLKVKLDSATSRRCLSSLYAARVEISVCVCVLTFVGKSWNMVMPCLPNNRGGGLPHSVMLSFEISAILVDISCLRLTPVSLSEEIWGPQDVNFCLEWSGEVECLCVCVLWREGGSLNTSGAQGFVGGVCLFSVSCSFNLISLHSFSFFVRIISSSLSLPPSACCDL